MITERMRFRARLPLIRARRERDSGPACLASVLHGVGRPTTLAEIRARCGAAGELTPSDLAEAGRGFGLEVMPLAPPLHGGTEPDDDTGDEPDPEPGDGYTSAERADPVTPLTEAPLPILLGWEGRYVLLERRHRRGWAALDPMAGRQYITQADLALDEPTDRFSIRPGPALIVDPARPSGRGWRLIVRQVTATPNLRGLLAGVIGLSVLLMVIGAVSPLLTKVLIDDVLPLRVPGVLPLVGIGLVCLMTTHFACDFLRGRILVLAEGQIDNRLMTSFFAHVVTLPYGFFREHSTGDIVQRFTSNSAIRNALTQQTLGGILDGTLVLVYAVVLMTVSPFFGLVAIAIGIVQSLLLLLPARRITRLTRAELEQVAHTQSFTVEIAAGAAYLKASGAASSLLRRWSMLIGRQIEVSMRRRRFMGLLGSLSGTLANSAGLILMMVGVAAVLQGSLTLGTALALLTLATNFLTPLVTLIGALQGLQAVQGHVERISDVLQLPPEQSDATRPPMPTVRGRIELRDLGAHYGDDGRWAVRGVTATVEPGQRLAIVGPSGSGKTTLAKLVLGLLEPAEGAVLVDGHDVQAHDLGSFRRQCGVVLQEPVVFDGSIRENVAFHDDEVRDVDVEWAVERACLINDVRELPDGLASRIAERGSALSGGQRQRLAIARALVRRPRLLVLDEATAELDALTETAVTASFRDLDCTTIVIAHRLSTVRDADMILVMEAGRLVDRGTHDELLARPGLYRDLVSGARDPVLHDGHDGAGSAGKDEPDGRARNGALVVVTPPPDPDPSSVSGRVVGADELPLAGALVTAIDAVGNQVDRALSDDSGSFQLCWPVGVEVQVVVGVAAGHRPAASRLYRETLDLRLDAIDDPRTGRDGAVVTSGARLERTDHGVVAESPGVPGSLPG